MDAPEIHPVHAHATGHRWFDYVIGGAALVVSLVSLYVAVHHGRTMEKMVQANSFPNLEPDYAILDAATAGSVVLSLKIRNSGVGPARVETLEMSLAQAPIASLKELVTAFRDGAQQEKLQSKIQAESVVGSLIGAGRDARLVSLEFADGATWFRPMLATADKLVMRVCYCSVFDECFVAQSGQRPARVAQCAKPAVPYDDSPIELLRQGVPADQKAAER